jgi:hypothetical protein
MTLPKNEPVVTQANTLRDWLRRGGWLVPAAALTVAPVLASSSTEDVWRDTAYENLSSGDEDAERMPGRIG